MVGGMGDVRVFGRMTHKVWWEAGVVQSRGLGMLRV